VSAIVWSAVPMISSVSPFMILQHLRQMLVQQNLSKSKQHLKNAFMGLQGFLKM